MEQQVAGAEDGAGAEGVPARDPGPNWALTAVGTLFAIGVLALAGWLVRFPADEFRYTSDMAGTPGTFTAAHCHNEGAGKSRTRQCEGPFVPHNGSPTDPAAHITNARVDVGKPAELRRTDGGGYVQPGVLNAGMDLAGVFGIFCGAAFLLMFPAAGPRRVKVETGVPLRANPQPWGTLVPLLLGLFVFFGAAAMLTLFGAVVLGVIGAIFF
ncbi:MULTISPECIES: hypothetical protein [Kitasatospora]|uniref:Uncharacterized protein n=1 Tax=Kitasatospora cystarginea TaxID=58350 RepID=A0ABN3EUU4_9ACTN